MPWFTKKRKKKASFGFSSHIQDRFWPFSACFGCFWPTLAVSAVSRYDPIWPIRPDFGRIRPVRRELKPIRHESKPIRHESKPIRHESKPIRHESSCVGANPRKKKNIDADQRVGNRVRRRVPRQAASDAGAAPLVPHPCFLGDNSRSRWWICWERVPLGINS